MRTRLIVVSTRTQVEPVSSSRRSISDHRKRPVVEARVVQEMGLVDFEEQGIREQPARPGEGETLLDDPECSLRSHERGGGERVVEVLGERLVPVAGRGSELDRLPEVVQAAKVTLASRTRPSMPSAPARRDCAAIGSVASIASARSRMRRR